MIKYLRLSLPCGFRAIADKPVAWLSSLFGLLGIPGILTWANHAELAPYVVFIAANLVVCIALAVGGYRLYRNDQMALASATDELRQIVDHHTEEMAKLSTPGGGPQNSGHFSGWDMSSNTISDTGGPGIQINYQSPPSP
ncbi:hypothetical protein [Arthrobacter sp. NyZ413]|uniref:hypothetical protein n=1 Tax=Arthrobacter sp. NyZ413 TaxID=3144669 RepID=UPI003BF7E0BD